jgi:hypothetical protein
MVGGGGGRRKKTYKVNRCIFATFRCEYSKMIMTLMSVVPMNQNETLLLRYFLSIYYCLLYNYKDGMRMDLREIGLGV